MGISKEGCKIKIQEILLRYFMDTVRTVDDNDRTERGIRYIIWKQRPALSSLYPVWTFDV